MSSSNSTRSWCKSWDCWCREPPPRLGTTLVIRGVAPAEHRGQGPTFWLAECLPQQRERVWLTKTFEVFAAQVTPAAFQKTEKETQTDELPAAIMMDQAAQTVPPRHMLPKAPPLLPERPPPQAKMTSNKMDKMAFPSDSPPDPMDLLGDLMVPETASSSSAGPWLGMRGTPTPSSSSQTATATDLRAGQEGPQTQTEPTDLASPSPSTSSQTAAVTDSMVGQAGSWTSVEPTGLEEEGLLGLLD